MARRDNGLALGALLGCAACSNGSSQSVTLPSFGDVTDAPAAIQTLLGQAIGLCETIREQEIASRAARTILRFHAQPKPRDRKRTTRRGPSPGSKAAALRDAAGASNSASPSQGAPAWAPSVAESPNHVADSPESPPHPRAPSLRFPVFPFRPQPRSAPSLNPISPIGPMGPMSPILPDPEQQAHRNGHHPP